MYTKSRTFWRLLRLLRVVRKMDVVEMVRKSASFPGSAVLFGARELQK